MLRWPSTTPQGGWGGNRNQKVNQPLSRDLCDHINAGVDVHGCIENNRSARYEIEMEHRWQFDTEHEGFASHQVPLPAGASGLCPFMERLRVVRWPVGFKVLGVNTYDGKANPAQWLTLYEITVRAAGGDEDVMANYLHIMLNQSVNN